MKFIIDKPVASKKNGYYIKIEFMHGDADGTTYEEYGPFHSDKFEEAYEFIDFLDFVSNQHYSGNGYKMVRNEDDAIWPDKYKKFIGPTGDELDKIDWDTHVWPFFSLYDQWPGDHTYQDGCAHLRDYEVYFINEHAKKFKVKVEK